jgi:hypothetical protein
MPEVGAKFWNCDDISSYSIGQYYHETEQRESVVQVLR